MWSKSTYSTQIPSRCLAALPNLTVSGVSSSESQKKNLSEGHEDTPIDDDTTGSDSASENACLHQFLIGTTSLRSKNEIHLVLYDENSDELSCTAIFSHPNGELWDLQPHPSPSSSARTATTSTDYGKLSFNSTLVLTAHNSGAEYNGTLYSLKLKEDSELNSTSLSTSSPSSFSSASSSGESALKTYLKNQGELTALASLPEKPDGRLHALTWNKNGIYDGAHCIAALDDRALKIFTTDDNAGSSTSLRETCRIAMPGKGEVLSSSVAAFDPHRSTCIATACDPASNSQGASVLLWDLQSGKPTSSLRNQSFTRNMNTSAFTRDIDWNPNKPFHLVTGCADGYMRFWDIRMTARSLMCVQSHTHWLWKSRYNPFHDQLLISCGSDECVNLWRIASISSAPLSTENTTLSSIEDDTNRMTKGDGGMATSPLKKMDDGGSSHGSSSLSVVPSDGGSLVGGTSLLGYSGKNPTDNDMLVESHRSGQQQSKSAGVSKSRSSEKNSTVYSVAWSVTDAWIYASLSYNALMSATSFDVVIVCTGTETSANWWQTRLSKSEILPSSAVVLAVHEDWEGGAGNGLGTLYAFQKAVAQAKESGHGDLYEKLRGGASIAIYHTAGKGTRLAPLPGAENNNKPGVRLPAVLENDGKVVNMSILESVIKQTGVYAKSRKGRVSVFWGDQVFIPSETPVYDASDAHADILCKLGPMVNEETWKEKKLESYGLIVVNKTGNAAQIEKVSHATALSLLANFGEVESVGVSLGSFSVSHELMLSLSEEFASELKAKKGKLDSDPHWWMPLTLEKESYVSLLSKKGVAESESSAHYERMQKFKATFEKRYAQPTSTSPPRKRRWFAAVNVGSDCMWWDYGQLKFYMGNNLKLARASTDPESQIMQNFFAVPKSKVSPKISSLVSSGIIDETSVVLGGADCQLGPGSKVKGSVLSNTSIKGQVKVENSMLVNVTAKSVTGKNVLLYNIVDDSDSGLVLKDGDVLADIFLPDGKKIRMGTNYLSKDSGKHWKVKIDGNEYTFEDVYKLNQTVDIAEAFAVAAKAHATLRAAF
eukprot:g1063.t1